MKHTLAALALILGTASAAQAATIQNGSFEEGPAAGSFVTLAAGSTAITGWTVGAPGNIDYIGSYWTASDGTRSIDLTGNSLGSISTTITGMIIGKAYRIAFDLSGNPAGQPASKKLDVTLSDPQTAQIYQYNYQTSGTTLGNMQWVTEFLTFVATSTESVLTFAAGNGGGSGNACCYGPALDNVQISAVPLPAGGLLLLSGLAGFAALRRRRKA